jgi:hypothetical protein
MTAFSREELATWRDVAIAMTQARGLVVTGLQNLQRKVYVRVAVQVFPNSARCQIDAGMA